MYEKVRECYNKYTMNFLKLEERSEYKLEPDRNRLILPGEEEDERGDQYKKMFQNAIKEEQSAQIEQNEEEEGKGQEVFDSN